MDLAAAETGGRYAIDRLRPVVEAAGAVAIAVGVVMSPVALAPRRHRLRPSVGRHLSGTERVLPHVRMEPDKHRRPYLRFTAMVATSTVIMFGLMYLNTYEVNHVFFSQTRAWMAVVMGAAMAVIMLGFMTHMLTNRAG